NEESMEYGRRSGSDLLNDYVMRLRQQNRQLDIDRIQRMEELNERRMELERIELEFEQLQEQRRQEEEYAQEFQLLMQRLLVSMEERRAAETTPRETATMNRIREMRDIDQQCDSISLRYTRRCALCGTENPPQRVAYT
ncbi:hypothetical protein PFISCL1PPCAC_15967, partial [Pristionchus fissidentatus]